MNFLDRSYLPKFQERLDLSASELNNMQEVFCRAINELAGRIYTISNLINIEDRSTYSSETNYLIIDTVKNLTTSVQNLTNTLIEIREDFQEQIDELVSAYNDFDARLNALDDAAARKEDLNVLLYRSGLE